VGQNPNALRVDYLISGWMTLNLGRMGDYMPHENKVFLPICENRLRYYDRMVNEIFKDKEKKHILTYQYFCNIWNKEFPNYVVGKVRYTIM
jgi:hypothetical protein